MKLLQPYFYNPSIGAIQSDKLFITFTSRQPLFKRLSGVILPGFVSTWT
jgi:hypothetical protein